MVSETLRNLLVTCRTPSHGVSRRLSETRGTLHNTFKILQFSHGGRCDQREIKRYAET